MVESVQESRSLNAAQPEELGEPLPLGSLPRRIQLPEIYVVARAAIQDSGYWVAEVLRACLGVVQDQHSLQMVDEVRVNASGDVAELALKITEPMSTATVQLLAQELKQKLAAGASFDIFPGAGCLELLIPAAELHVEYFRREFAGDSRMVSHTTSCVRLTHRPTGIVARSMDHRSRIVNYEEALYLLASLLKLRA